MPTMNKADYVGALLVAVGTVCGCSCGDTQTRPRDSGASDSIVIDAPLFDACRACDVRDAGPDTELDARQLGPVDAGIDSRPVDLDLSMEADARQADADAEPIDAASPSAHRSPATTSIAAPAT